MSKNPLHRTPEIILIGEKDADALKEALAASSGGYVYSTVHSNDATSRQVLLGERDLKQLVRSFQQLTSNPNLPAPADLATCDSVVQQLLEEHPHLAGTAPPASVNTVKPTVQNGPATPERFMVETAKANRAEVLGPLGTQTTKKLGGRLKKEESFVWTHAAALEGTLLFGCCGSGRSEALPTLAMEAARTGGGVFYMSAISDPNLHQRAARLGQHIGRLDEVRYVHAYPTRGREDEYNACRYNPLDDGSPEDLVEWFMDVIEPMFTHIPKAPEPHHVRACITPAMHYLSWQRNAGLVPMDLQVLKELLTLPALEAACDKPHSPLKVRSALNTWRQLCQQDGRRESLAAAMTFVVDDILSPLLDFAGDTLRMPRAAQGWLKSELIVSEAWDRKQLVFFEAGAIEKAPPALALFSRMPLVRLNQVVKKASARMDQAHQVHMVLFANDAQLYADAKLVDGFNGPGQYAGLGRMWITRDYPQLKQHLGEQTTLAMVGSCPFKLFMATCEKGHITQLAEDTVPPLHAAYHAAIAQALPHADRAASTQTQAAQTARLHDKPLRQLAELEALDQLHPGQMHAIAGSRLVRLDMVYADLGTLPQAELPKLAERVWKPHSAPVTMAAPGTWAKRLFSYWSQHPVARNPAGQARLSGCQEAVARMLGWSSWHDLTQQRR